MAGGRWQVAIDILNRKAVFINLNTAFFYFTLTATCYLQPAICLVILQRSQVAFSIKGGHTA